MTLQVARSDVQQILREQTGMRFQPVSLAAGTHPRWLGTRAGCIVELIGDPTLRSVTVTARAVAGKPQIARQNATIMVALAVATIPQINADGLIGSLLTYVQQHGHGQLVLRQRLIRVVARQPLGQVVLTIRAARGRVYG